MSFGPNLKWISNNFKSFNLKLIFLFVSSSLITFLILMKTDLKMLFLSILLLASLYLLFVTISDFFKKNQKNISQKISHLGFSLLILSIILNSLFSNETITNIKIGENYKFNKTNIYFDKIDTFEKENYVSIIGYFRIKADNEDEILFYPELRVFNQPKTITSEADIKLGLFKDKFLVMNLVKGDDYYNIRYQNKAYMVWIWLSAGLMSIGGLINFFRKKQYE